MRKEEKMIRKFYKTIIGMDNLKGVPVEFLVELSRFVEEKYYDVDNNERYIILDNRRKNILCEKLHVTKNTINNYIKRMVDKNELVKLDDNKYQLIFPLIFYYDWLSVDNLKIKYDFVNNKVDVYIGIED